MKKIFLNGETWFFEGFLPGETIVSSWGAKIEKEIYSGKSQFQKIDVFDTKEFGRILLLDDMVQLSTKHEHIYHEMLVHPAFLYHRKTPEKVLIIGGGDGGVLREAVKHGFKEIFLVDIDDKVIEVSKKYLPSVSHGAFKDKRVKVFTQDALGFVKNRRNYFDIIINDLTDSTGVSLALWSGKFYQDILKALRPKGVAGFQTAYLKEKFAQQARKRIRKIFPYGITHRAFVDCFPFDEHTFTFVSRDVDFGKITLGRIKNKFAALKLQTKYYSPEIHFASLVFPREMANV